jgi:hypothetical protein
MKNNARVNLKINEPEGGREEQAPSTSETSQSESTRVVDDALEDLKGI